MTLEAVSNGTHAGKLRGADQETSGGPKDHPDDGQSEHVRLSCFYGTFKLTEARRLVEKIERVHTPKQGSWLNMAECELSLLEKPAFGKRIDGETRLRKQVALGESDRNHRVKGIEWPLRTADARIKLRRLCSKTTPG